MNYPFLYKVLGNLNIENLRTSLVFSGEKTNVWDDWHLLSIESGPVREFLQTQFPHLKIFKDTLYVSQGTQSNFHIDRFHVYHVLHRILIPLDQDYRYEWILNEKLSSYEPKAGEVLLFNNMIPHRFVSESGKKREAVYLDLYDPLIESRLDELKGNYSHENALLEKKYSDL